MTPHRDGSVTGSVPRSKVRCDRPLSMAIGIGGRRGGDEGVWVEKDLTICTKKRVCLGASPSGTGGEVEATEGLGETRGGEAAGVGKDWVIGASSAGARVGACQKDGVVACVGEVCEQRDFYRRWLRHLGAHAEGNYEKRGRWSHRTYIRRNREDRGFENW